ncbi:MAG: hypothetical protein ABJH05_05900 [Fulvivirga sp.]
MIRNKIWYELVNIKYGECYLSKYLGFQRTLSKSFKLITLLLSVSGILGWKYFEDYAWIAFILIAIMQLLTLIENTLIRSDKEIEGIAALKMNYTRYFNKLEQLWTDLQNDRLAEDSASDHFFELRKTDWEQIEVLDAQLNIKKYRILMNKTDIDTTYYLEKYLL